jgi:hypothetical protein
MVTSRQHPLSSAPLLISQPVRTKKRKHKLLLGWHEIQARRDLNRAAAGLHNDLQLITNPPPLFLPLAPHGDGTVTAPAVDASYTPRPASDQLLLYPAGACGAEAGRVQKQRQSRKRGRGRRRAKKGHAPPLNDKATFHDFLHHHQAWCQTTSEKNSVGIRHLMPDLWYHHIVRSLQDPLHLQRLQRSDKLLYRHLHSLVTRNARFYLFYTMTPHPAQQQTQVLMPALYACTTANRVAHPSFPRGNDAVITCVRVIPMSQVEQVLRHTSDSKASKVGLVRETIKTTYACIPTSVVNEYFHYDVNMQRKHAVSRRNKRPFKFIRASRQWER